LEQGFHKTAHGDVSLEVQNNIPKTFPRLENSPGGRKPAILYEAHFDDILADIRNTNPNHPNLQTDYRIALSLYLLGFSRNQVAHKIDETTKLFKQIDDAKFLVDLFITLCRTDEWKCTIP